MFIVIVTWVGGFTFSYLDMAPDFVGILQGINLTIASLAGFVMPIVIGKLTPSVIILIITIQIYFR